MGTALEFDLDRLRRSSDEVSAGDERSAARAQLRLETDWWIRGSRWISAMAVVGIE